MQSPFLLVQQHGLTGCARHVVDVGNDHAGKRLTIHNEVHIDGLAATLCHRLHNGLLDGRKRRFDVRSALLIAQHGKKLSVRRDDRTARKRTFESCSKFSFFAIKSALSNETPKSP